MLLEAEGGRWRQGEDEGKVGFRERYWISGMFPASSFTLFFRLHLSSPESSLNDNSIKASPVVPVTGWRGHGLEISAHGRCGSWISAGRA